MFRCAADVHWLKVETSDHIIKPGQTVTHSCGGATTRGLGAFASTPVCGLQRSAVDLCRFPRWEFVCFVSAKLRSDVSRSPDLVQNFSCQPPQ
ncbi:hypothetical protein F2P81_023190 [Scophthalmus maximus]|uniref:Uncharacterized protein n=1 Tax=Scophthalmus maximus TaxID=52904 RepID=A0A6A4RWV8_SCOMX|nr:hypothetical protein F2P81_023190 [Scophthalmus maximus]